MVLYKGFLVRLAFFNIYLKFFFTFLFYRTYHKSHICIISLKTLLYCVNIFNFYEQVCRGHRKYADIS